MTYRYLVRLTIDQRPARTEWVNQRVFDCFKRLGWLDDGRAVLLEESP